MSDVLLLGPLRPGSLEAATRGRQGPVALIAAAVRDDPSYVAEWSDQLPDPVQDLGLYRRFRDVADRVPELRRAWHERSEIVHEYNLLYRRRNRHAHAAIEELWRVSHQQGDPHGRIARELDDAIQALRRLDRHHLRGVLAAERAAQDDLRLHSHPVVVPHREELLQALERCAGVVLCGGHVMRLRNRLRFFGLDTALAGCRRRGAWMLGWSAGAMLLTRRLVLFHDDPPQGHIPPEVFDGGLDVAPELVVLPDASRRLHLDDPRRVGVLSRRFAPETVLGLDPGAIVAVSDGSWRALAPGVLTLTPAGTAVPVEVH